MSERTKWRAIILPVCGVVPNRWPLLVGDFPAPSVVVASVLRTIEFMADGLTQENEYPDPSSVGTRCALRGEKK